MDGVQILEGVGYERISTSDEEKLKQAVRQVGPVSVMFQVMTDFVSYSDGIYSAGAQCTPAGNTINHALLVIGFGTDNNVDYWLVQNSWGVGWGQGGYGKIRRGVNTCGIALCGSYPINIVDPQLVPLRSFQSHLYDPVKTGAMCLDGTRAGLYYSKGWGSGKNKTIVHFSGGGWCYGMDE